PTRWLVPAVLRFRDSRGAQEKRVLLRDAEETVDLGAQGPVQWLLGNSQARGFYRAAYDAEALQKILGALGEKGAVRPEERMSLISDQWALVRAGAAPVDALLD